jgi:hypothetical protein
MSPVLPRSSATARGEGSGLADRSQGDRRLAAEPGSRVSGKTLL